MTNPKADAFIERNGAWGEALQALRALALDAGLTETIKWGKPCYTTDEGANVAILQPFKDHCDLMFFKGALLDDPEGVLVRPGENSRVARRIEFDSAERVAELEPVVKACLAQAIDAERKGLEVEVDDAPEPVPDELRAALDDDPALAEAFGGLTPGRRREYVLYVSGAKQASTRVDRVERYRDKILDGKGLRD